MRVGLGPGSGEIFSLLAQAGANAAAIAVKVEQRFREYPSTSVSQDDVKELEHAGDRIASDLIRSVNAQFISPYESDDLIALAFAIDDVPDAIENASELLGLYSVET